ncbi:MAG: ATP-binding cassette domain-containing protein [Spirochaetales bacterium]|nr:ATP-binding cassette domain-containing protein [Spirochaetales bacterium]
MIQIRDLTVAFSGRTVLDHLSLDVYEGKTLVVLGRSGIGKSVLLKAVLGLLPVQGGSVEIDGVEVLKASVSVAREYRGRVGMLLQNGGLFDSMSVFDNIAFPLRYHKLAPEAEIRGRVEHYAELVDLKDALAVFPQDLSGGMRRRAALARAIIQNPKYLFYDEPSTGLDPSTSALVEILIRRVKEELGITTLIVTHDVDMVMFLGEDVALLSEGHITARQDLKTVMTPGSEIWEQFISQREKAHREHGF